MDTYLANAKKLAKRSLYAYERSSFLSLQLKKTPKPSITLNLQLGLREMINKPETKPSVLQHATVTKPGQR
jgi:hypothetical protein